MESALSPEHADDTMYTPGISLAFSGGGKRASLYSLGSLLALVEAGLHSEVNSISSVSGGSITNAAIGQRLQLDRASAAEFHSVCDELQRELTGRRHRATLLTLLAMIVVTVPVLEVGMAVLLPPMFRLPIIGRLTPTLTSVIWVVTQIIAFLSAVLIVLSGRTRLQTWMVSRIFFRLGVSGRRNDATVGDLTTRTIEHVLCLTDLETGGPLFTVNDRVHCDGGMTTTDGTLTLAEVVTASAALPAAFIPMKLTYQPLGRLERRRQVIVTDGGVFNNLATEWILPDSLHCSIFWGDGVRPPDRSAHVFVLDASLPAEAVSISSKRLDGMHGTFPFGVAVEMFYLRRNMLVMYQSGLRVQQRLLALDDQLSSTPDQSISYLTIAQSPLDYAQGLSEIDNQPFAGRAAAAVDELQRIMTREDWDRMRQVTCAMRTDLGPVDAATARSVMTHGYYAMRVALRVRFGTAIDEPRLGR